MLKQDSCDVPPTTSHLKMLFDLVVDKYAESVGGEDEKGKPQQLFHFEDMQKDKQRGLLEKLRQEKIL